LSRHTGPRLTQRGTAPSTSCADQAPHSLCQQYHLGSGPRLVPSHVIHDQPPACTHGLQADLFGGCWDQPWLMCQRCAPRCAARGIPGRGIPCWWGVGRCAGVTQPHRGIVCVGAGCTPPVVRWTQMSISGGSNRAAVTHTPLRPPSHAIHLLSSPLRLQCTLPRCACKHTASPPVVSVTAAPVQPANPLLQANPHRQGSVSLPIRRRGYALAALAARAHDTHACTTAPRAAGAVALCPSDARFCWCCSRGAKCSRLPLMLHTPTAAHTPLIWASTETTQRPKQASVLV